MAMTRSRRSPVAYVVDSINRCCCRERSVVSLVISDSRFAGDHALAAATRTTSSSVRASATRSLRYAGVCFPQSSLRNALPWPHAGTSLAGAIGCTSRILRPDIARFWCYRSSAVWGKIPIRVRARGASGAIMRSTSSFSLVAPARVESAGKGESSKRGTARASARGVDVKPRRASSGPLARVIGGFYNIPLGIQERASSRSSGVSLVCRAGVPRGASSFYTDVRQMASPRGLDSVQLTLYRTRCYGAT